MAKLKDPFKDAWKRDYNVGRYTYKANWIAAGIIITAMFIILMLL